MTDLVNLTICGRGEMHSSVDAIRSIALPDQTESYTPVGHAQLFDMAESMIQGRGYEIVQQKHLLARGGDHYFALMQIDNGADRSADAQIVGLRNSFNKTLPATLLAGNSVWLCSNLLFGAEIAMKRRHTSNIWADLRTLMSGALDSVGAAHLRHDERMEGYRNVGLCDSEAHDLIAQAFLLGALGKVQVAEVVQQWHSPNHPEFKERNVYALLNAFTEVFKGRLDLLPSRSATVQTMLDGVVEVEVSGHPWGA